MLTFVNFKNVSTCLHGRILDVMLRVLSNILMFKLTDTCLFGDMNRIARLFLVLKKKID